MSLRDELIAAAEGADFVHMATNEGSIIVHWPDAIMDRVLGRVSDYKHTSSYFYGPFEQGRGRKRIDLCFMRGSIAGIETRHGPRAYEYQYLFARKLGGFIGRKMKANESRFLKLSIRSDNEYRRWFRHPSPPERKCFHREFYSAWRETQRHRSGVDCEWRPHMLSISVLDDCMLFVDLHDIPKDRGRCVRDILRCLKEDKQMKS